MLESPVKIISRADVARFPLLAQRQPRHRASARCAGLVCGIVVAFLIEYLDTSVKTMADAETLLGLPVLTIIPNKGGPMPLTQQTGPPASRRGLPHPARQA